MHIYRAYTIFIFIELIVSCEIVYANSHNYSHYVVCREIRESKKKRTEYITSEFSQVIYMYTHHHSTLGCYLLTQP